MAKPPFCPERPENACPDNPRGVIFLAVTKAPLRAFPFSSTTVPTRLPPGRQINVPTSSTWTARLTALPPAPAADFPPVLSRLPGLMPPAPRPPFFPVPQRSGPPDPVSKRRSILAQWGPITSTSTIPTPAETTSNPPCASVTVEASGRASPKPYLVTRTAAPATGVPASSCSVPRITRSLPGPPSTAPPFLEERPSGPWVPPCLSQPRTKAHIPKTTANARMTSPPTTVFDCLVTNTPYSFHPPMDLTKPRD